jgi:four helix bundle protein
VWQLARALAARVYKATENCPARERFGLAAQKRSACVSIASNIAEGYGRNNRGEYVQFLGIANGSLKELETQLLIAKEGMPIPDASSVLEECEAVGRLLGSLIRSLRE